MQTENKNHELEPWSKEWVIEEHRKMYRWIAEKLESEGVTTYLDEYKENYLYEHGFIPKEIKCRCFCCEYNCRNTNMPCESCLLDWKAVSGCSYCDRGGLWHQLKDTMVCALENKKDMHLLEECINLAKRIAEVPEKL